MSAAHQDNETNEVREYSQRPHGRVSRPQTEIAGEEGVLLADDKERRNQKENGQAAGEEIEEQFTARPPAWP